MPFYEFECPKGHVTEKLVPMDTKAVECVTCRCWGEELEAKRILSPTPTTFVAAGGRKL